MMWGNIKQWREYDESLCFLFVVCLTPLTFSFDLKRSGWCTSMLHQCHSCCLYCVQSLLLPGHLSFTKSRGLIRNSWLYRQWFHCYIFKCNTTSSRSDTPSLWKKYIISELLSSLHMWPYQRTEIYPAISLTLQSKHLQHPIKKTYVTM